MKWFFIFFCLIPISCFAALPQVLMFGDSIDLARSAYARLDLYLVADVRHAFWGNENNTPQENFYYISQQVADGANDGYSTTLYQDEVAQLWVGTSWDVITVSVGLHDMQRFEPGGICDVNNPSANNVMLSQYKDNLANIFTLAKQHAAHVIWIDSTEVPSGNSECVSPSDVPIYNDAADQVAQQYGVVILSPITEYQIVGDVHFTSQGYSLLGAQVSACVMRVLNGDTTC